MSTLLNPYMAVCACGWELACSSLAEKQRREDAHTQRRHTSTTEAVTALVTADPSRTEDVKAVIEAIEMTARNNDGQVDPNEVRRLLPSWVLPQAVGAVYNQLVAQGRLERIGWTTNEDRRGRNYGKPISLWLLKDAK